MCAEWTVHAHVSQQVIEEARMAGNAVLLPPPSPSSHPDAASLFPFDDMTDITLSFSQRGQDVTGRRTSEGDREMGDGVGGQGEAEKAFGNMDL